MLVQHSLAVHQTTLLRNDDGNVNATPSPTREFEARLRRGYFKKYITIYANIGGNVNKGKSESFPMASLRQIQIRFLYDNKITVSI